MSEVLFTNCPQCGEGFAVHADKPVCYCPRCGVEMRPDALPAKTVLIAEDVAQLVRLKELELEQAKIADAARRRRNEIKVGSFLFLTGLLVFIVFSLLPSGLIDGSYASSLLMIIAGFSAFVGLIELASGTSSSNRQKRKNNRS
ncbi:MAG: hypothetical protein E7317_02510 [Clostridiales bacterium]|nr:hypothetical protein [Clostridiales bacterium]